MRKAALTIALMSGWLVSCNTNEPESETVLQQTLTDSVAAPATATQDTTMQSVVELTLRAVGNTIEELHYDQDTLVIAAGAHVMLNLVNEGTEPKMVHNFVVTTHNKYKDVAEAGAKVASPGNYTPDSKHVITATPLALPGQTVQHEFTSPPAGTYSFVCTYPDHWPKMHGTLIVKE